MTDTPAPLSADSLRTEVHIKMLAKSDSAKDLGELTVIPLGFAVSIAVELITGERQRIADSLPEKKTLETDLPLDADEDDTKFCVECGQWEFEGVLDCKCVGFNEAIEAVRAVLIPPTGKLGDSETSEEANSDA